VYDTSTLTEEYLDIMKKKKQQKTM